MSGKKPIQVSNSLLPDSKLFVSYILVAIIIVLFLILLMRIFAGDGPPNTVDGPVVIDARQTRHIKVKELAEHLRNRREKLSAAMKSEIVIALHKPQIEKINKNLKRFISQIPKSTEKDELYDHMMTSIQLSNAKGLSDTIRKQEDSLEHGDVENEHSRRKNDYSNGKTGKECFNEMIGKIEMIENALTKGLISNGFLDLTPMTDLLLSLDQKINNEVLPSDKKIMENISLTNAQIGQKCKGFGDSCETLNHQKIDKEFKGGYQNTIGSMEFESFD